MPTVYIDNKPHEVQPGRNMLDVSLSSGYDLPYFCWHPAFGSVGACRQCAVKQFKDENDQVGRMAMACMVGADEGTRISIQDEEARQFRASVIEWLMVNHPHDCPVCDEGGECHLQDMTVMTGHDYREYRFGKRTYRNQYLGPFINHEMNRCIQCYRCVRFYREYAGGRDLDVFAAHDQIYFGRHADGVLENEFSGNLVEVCPTGVFTDKTLKQHYTRKWDLQTAPSVCHHCGVGCNTIAGERYGGLRRILNRYNSQVNRYFLCDRGRFGYEFVNSPQRVRQPREKPDGQDELQATSKEDALEALKKRLADAEVVLGIGSPRASLEANFALRTLVGSDRFYSGVGRGDQDLTRLARRVLSEGPARAPSLKSMEAADAIFVLGEDVTNTAPRLTLTLQQSVRNEPIGEMLQGRAVPRWHDAAVREVVQNQKGPLFVAAPYATRLDSIARETWCAAPEDLARLGYAVAHALCDQSPPVEGLSDQQRELAERIATALRGAEQPLVISGAGCGSREVMEAAANVAWALHRCDQPSQLYYALPECNSMGLEMLEAPDLDEALQAVQETQNSVVLVLENDLYRRAEPQKIDALFKSAGSVVALDYLDNPTVQKADMVLPAGTFAEGDGTLVSSEGRAQRFYQVFVPEGEIQESWRWLRDLSARTEQPIRPAEQEDGRGQLAAWRGLDDVVSSLASAVPALSNLTQLAPQADYRAAGTKIPRQPHRYSGRTAMHADRDVHEPKPPDDPDAPLAYSMEGYDGQPPPPLTSRYWAPGWNSVQALNKFQVEVGGPMRGGDPGLRLLEPADQPASWFDRVPEAFIPREGRWLVVPRHHIFGSDESSAAAPAVAERSPQPQLYIHPEDLKQLGDPPPSAARLTLGSVASTLPIAPGDDLPRGVVALPVGLAGMTKHPLPAWGEITGRDAS